MSIFALTGQSMESSGINSIEDIGSVVGGVEIIGDGSGRVQIALRGVTNLAAESLEATAAVGYYLDEVPMAAMANAMPELAMWDVDRVEVLRGPQGTLLGAYGRYEREHRVYDPSCRALDTE